jgi:hypothetical protein
MMDFDNWWFGNKSCCDYSCLAHDDAQEVWNAALDAAAEMVRGKKFTVAKTADASTYNFTCEHLISAIERMKAEK